MVSPIGPFSFLFDFLEQMFGHEYGVGNHRWNERADR